MSFKQMVESPVGLVGRTSHADADDYIDGNPAIIEDFRKIVNNMGGKAVARRVLDRLAIKTKQNLTNETVEDIESYLRNIGFKIRKVYPIKDGKEIEFYKASEMEEATEDLKSAGFLEKYEISNDGYKTITAILK